MSSFRMKIGEFFSYAQIEKLKEVSFINAEIKGQIDYVYSFWQSILEFKDFKEFDRQDAYELVGRGLGYQERIFRKIYGGTSFDEKDIESKIEKDILLFGRGIYRDSTIIEAHRGEYIRNYKQLLIEVEKIKVGLNVNKRQAEFFVYLLSQSRVRTQFVLGGSLWSMLQFMNIGKSITTNNFSGFSSFEFFLRKNESAEKEFEFVSPVNLVGSEGVSTKVGQFKLYIKVDFSQLDKGVTEENLSNFVKIDTQKTFVEFDEEHAEQVRNLLGLEEGDVDVLEDVIIPNTLSRSIKLPQRLQRSYISSLKTALENTGEVKVRLFSYDDRIRVILDEIIQLPRVNIELVVTSQDDLGKLLTGVDKLNPSNRAKLSIVPENETIAKRMLSQGGQRMTRQDLTGTFERFRENKEIIKKLQPYIKQHPGFFQDVSEQKTREVSVPTVETVSLSQKKSR